MSKCEICGNKAVGKYEGINSCGLPVCEYGIQEGLDHLAEVGSN